MKLSASEKESLVGLLARIYGDIRDIEEEFNLLAGNHDFRPRIEYFHDAIRAFTSQDAKELEAGGRLSIELLAYDLSCLRYIHAQPLAPFTPHGETLSPHTEVVAVKPGLVPKAKRPERAVRERISELYQHYAVLFAALLKPFADRDYQDRVSDLNEDVRDINAIIQQLAGGKSIEQIMASINHLDDDELRQLLTRFLQEQRHKKSDDCRKMNDYLKQQSTRKDKDIAAIEAAHMNYALAQLAVFEGSRDFLKKMAGQGMNLVGKFVEDAMAKTQREMGR